MQIEIHPALSCNKCLCRKCLLWWSGRCPHGGCYDDLRAKEKPWDEAHPNNAPRTSWSGWRSDQKHWCRGGVFYATTSCPHFVEYSQSETTVRECLGCNVTQFQDDYIVCTLLECMGCEECYKRFQEKEEEEKEK